MKSEKDDKPPKSLNYICNIKVFYQKNLTKFEKFKKKYNLNTIEA